jgi:pSer/pThr/pTyr-binding forkhead associated (FHA) protein
MGFEVNGRLVPIGGGDPYPLTAESMRVGRRHSCDIWLDYDNVSNYHCELLFAKGCWQVNDLHSTNGTKVNGVRVQKKKLRPGDKVTIANHAFTIEYHLAPDAEIELNEDVLDEDIMSKPLLERAGLTRKRRDQDEYRRRLIDEAMNDHEDDDD